MAGCLLFWGGAQSIRLGLGRPVGVRLAQEGTPGSVDLGGRAWSASPGGGCGRWNSKMPSSDLA